MIKPLYDRVFIKRLENKKNQTAGGIYIPESAQEKAQQGEVLAVGEGKIENGELKQIVTGKH